MSDAAPLIERCTDRCANLESLLRIARIGLPPDSAIVADIDAALAEPAPNAAPRSEGTSDHSDAAQGREATGSGNGQRPAGSADPAEPVAYGIRVLSDNSYSQQIVPVGYRMFDRLMEAMRNEPCVRNGTARIVPLYAAPVAIAESGDRVDAERYRWLRNQCISEEEIQSPGGIIEDAWARGESPDAVIDAARSPDGEK